MRRFAPMALALSVLLAGCASTGPYGNYIQDSGTLDQTQAAHDTVTQLARLYPPAKTRFELMQPTPDPFGRALVQELRQRGFAVQESDRHAARTSYSSTDSEPGSPAPGPFNTDSHGSTPVHTESAPAPAPAPAHTTDATGTASLALYYVFDQIPQIDLYRLTITVADQSITRAYRIENGSLAPAGYWSRKE